ncbi:hypothetical protein QTO34_007839 [Cnephaeus nilssonii]|uniref:Uncharacterized protein n=1 Tax=Cnephaeus nilssonii TaxID=3371016 RepID=A0AA40HJ86_CNENI|nr:hypothetical protein QTO34_007839 [Eptesicus nilssonii]
MITPKKEAQVPPTSRLPVVVLRRLLHGSGQVLLSTVQLPFNQLDPRVQGGHLSLSLFPTSPFSRHSPLGALGPLFGIIGLLLQNLDLAFHHLSGEHATPLER